MTLLLGLGLGRGVHAAPDHRTVALLPLDADARLELYGQPVASEIARALVAGGIDVVVVGHKMAVPERAMLIVDGTIRAKGDAVVISLRVRNRLDGTVLATLASTAATLATLDQAASELSARLAPAVTQQLSTAPPPPSPSSSPSPSPPALGVTPPVAAKRPMIIAVGASTAADPGVAPLARALATAADAWIASHDREPRHVELAAMSPTSAVKTVAAARTELGITFEVARYAILTGEVPYARARVRVRVAAASGIVFDRVVVTDSVVGDKGISLDQLTARVADEILAILRPHMRRTIGGWR
ncbi:MAG: hypothetical protein NT062_01765 [Proteobacteria bacterium]|nr:hypothetical protein [Pseudomonadota bacterium]